MTSLKKGFISYLESYGRFTVVSIFGLFPVILFVFMLVIDSFSIGPILFGVLVSVVDLILAGIVFPIFRKEIHYNILAFLFPKQLPNRKSEEANNFLVRCFIIMVVIMILNIIVAALHATLSPNEMDGQLRGNPSPTPTNHGFVTDTPSATNTPTPSATATPTASPTATSTNTLTITPQLVETPCILAEHWYATWILQSDNDQPVLRDPDNLACYDFAPEGFIAEWDDQNDMYGIHISCGDVDSDCVNEGKIRGIFTYLPAGNYEFQISIISAEILKENREVNDVDLIIGVGEPISFTGKFIIFRRVNKNGKIFFCALKSHQEYCTPISSVTLEEFGERQVTINMGSVITLEINGEQVAQFEYSDSESRKLWIGYSFRSAGYIDAFIGFPSSIWEYIDIDK